MQDETDRARRLRRELQRTNAELMRQNLEVSALFDTFDLPPEIELGFEACELAPLGAVRG